jgi:hypothetical protein
MYYVGLDIHAKHVAVCVLTGLECLPWPSVQIIATGDPAEPTS